MGTPDARDTTAVCVVLALFAALSVRGALALWPDWAFLAPAVLAAVSAVGFVGVLGRVLLGEHGGVRASLTAETLVSGVRIVVVAAIYLFVPAVALGGLGALLGSGAAAGAARFPTAILSSIVLLVVLAFAYLLPVAAAAAVEDGVAAGVRGGTSSVVQSGAYFLAWVGAAVLVVFGWAALGASGGWAPVAAVAVLGFGYAHVAAARLLAAGLERARRRG